MARVTLKWQNTPRQPLRLPWGRGWPLLRGDVPVSRQPLCALLWGPWAGHLRRSPAPAQPSLSATPHCSQLSQQHTRYFFLSFPFHFFIRMQNIKYHSCNYG